MQFCDYIETLERYTKDADMEVRVDNAVHVHRRTKLGSIAGFNRLSLDGSHPDARSRSTDGRVHYTIRVTIPSAVFGAYMREHTDLSWEDFFPNLIYGREECYIVPAYHHELFEEVANDVYHWVQAYGTVKGETWAFKLPTSLRDPQEIEYDGRDNEIRFRYALGTCALERI